VRASLEIVDTMAPEVFRPPMWGQRPMIYDEGDYFGRTVNIAHGSPRRRPRTAFAGGTRS
jgi:hypothetical protein